MEKINLKAKAAAFDSLINHLQNRTDVQNIDLMILADFCRNCLAKWYMEAANNHGENLDYDQARELVYGMPYSQWKEKFQLPATDEQLAAFENRNAAKN